LSEAGLDDADRPTPRQQQQQQQSRGVPLGTDNRDDHLSDWDESVRSA